jgi:hypothetical protein
LGSVSQYGVPAEADGAVHITPAAKAAVAAPTVAINALVFMLDSFSLEDDGTLPPRITAVCICNTPPLRINMPTAGNCRR